MVISTRLKFDGETVLCAFPFSGRKPDFTVLQSQHINPQVVEEVNFKRIGVTRKWMGYSAIDKLFCDGVKCDLLHHSAMFDKVFHIEVMLRLQEQDRLNQPQNPEMDMKL